MSDNVIQIRPLNPYIQDEWAADGSREQGPAWICIDKRWILAADNSGGFVNIEVDDVMAADLMAQLGQYFARRVYRYGGKE